MQPYLPPPFFGNHRVLLFFAIFLLLWLRANKYTYTSMLLTTKHTCKSARLCMYNNVNVTVELSPRFCDDRQWPITTTGVFVDVLCANQHVSGVNPDGMKSHQSNLYHAKHVLLIVDHRGTALSRLWCCYEAWMAVMFDKRDGLLAILDPQTPQNVCKSSIRRLSLKLQVFALTVGKRNLFVFYIFHPLSPPLSPKYMEK